MVLLLLVILALLLWSIQAEMEPGEQGDDSVEIECPGCRRAIDIDYMVCPHCQKRTREACGVCHKGKLISHQFCPHCGSGHEGGDQYAHQK